MKRVLLPLLLLALVLGACGQASPTAPSPTNSQTAAPALPPLEGTEEQLEENEMKLTLVVNGTAFPATLEHNRAVTTLVQKLQDGPLTLTLEDYAGFEKVGSLGFSLPGENRQMTTQRGDVVLYAGNQLVIFYGSNSWSYTKLATIDDLSGWENALGSGDVRVTLSLNEK